MSTGVGLTSDLKAHTCSVFTLGVFIFTLVVLLKILLGTYAEVYLEEVYRLVHDARFFEFHAQRPRLGFSDGGQGSYLT